MLHDLNDIKSTKGLKILHVNIRSLLAHWDEVESVLLDGQLDIVVFTETWLHANCKDNLLAVRGYRCIRLDRCVANCRGTIKKGGGICVFVKNDFEIFTWSNLDVSTCDIEMLSISCKKGNQKRTNLTVVYRPPTGNVNSALDNISECISEVRRAMSGNTVVIGDLNVDLSKQSAHTHRLEQFANQCNLNQLIDSPTRISISSETLIDHLYTDIHMLQCQG